MSNARIEEEGFEFAQFTIARMTEKGLLIAKRIDMNEALDQLINDLSEDVGAEKLKDDFNLDLSTVTSYYESF
jgi:hypothetical protein